MDASDVQHLTDNEGTVEVLVGMNPDANQGSNHLEAYLGDSGEIVTDAGFDIYRVRMAAEVLSDLIQTEPTWIDYVENSELD